ncbi:MAG: amidohydrolase family protein [Spirochaetota bacterium]
MQVYNGNVITCDGDDTVAGYLVEDKGRILYVGNELPQEYAAAGNLIELRDKALIPAFADGHLHFSNWALVSVSYFDVRSAGNFHELRTLINEFARKDRKSKVLFSFGISKHSLEEKRLVTREELDEMYSERPLMIIGYDGHSLIGNSKLIDRYPEEIKSLRGFNADSGQLVSEAYYRGLDFSTSQVPPFFLINSILRSFDLLAERGIGLIHPVEGIGFPLDLDVKMVSLIARACSRRNGFQTRVFFQTMDTEKVLKRGLPRIGGCFATALDGCFGACDAALAEPYSHDSGNKGILFYSDDEIIRFTKAANRAGLQIEMHAIGDAAVTQAVMAIGEALKDFPRQDHRHTLIHACLLSRKNLEKCAELGIGITLQPGFLVSPLEPAEYLKEILGSRMGINSPLRDMVDAGIHLSGGSDAPVTPPDPIEGLYGACNHPYNPAQSLTIQEALKMFTYEVARTSFDEKDRGSLEKGKIADMVILNRNPLEMDPQDLKSLKIEKLMLRGREYQPGMRIPGMLIHALLGAKEMI